MNKRCAIIGSTGYIGKHLVHYLQSVYHIEPECYDVVPNDGTMSHYMQIDLTNKESLQNLNLDVDYLFAFAGLTGTHVSFERYEQYTKVNEIGLLNLLDYISQSPYRPRIVYPSSRLVYKGADRPLQEEAEKEAKTMYAVEKIACEYALEAYQHRFGIPYIVFRICVPYGNMLKGDYSYGTIGAFVRRARSKEDISLYGGGDTKRTFTHIEDVCYHIVNGAFTYEGQGDVFNVGGETLSLRDAAQIIADKYGVKVLSVDWPEKDLLIESGHTYFDDSKIRSLLSQTYTYKLLEAYVNDL